MERSLDHTTFPNCYITYFFFTEVFCGITIFRTWLLLNICMYSETCLIQHNREQEKVSDKAGVGILRVFLQG